MNCYFNSTRQIVYLLVSGFILTVFLNSCTKKPIVPPKAEKIKKELTIHGDTRIDNYYWMNERNNPKVIGYLNAENEYTENAMKHNEGLQKKLYEEIVGRIKQDDNTVPYKKNGYYYYTRYKEGKEYPIYARKIENLDNDEEILLDVNQMAEGYSFYMLLGLEISENNNILAFGVDTVSRRKYTIYFKDLESGKILEDKIPNTTGSVVWANDNKTVFYTIKDSTLRPHKIMKHRLGTDLEKDLEVYHERDNTFRIYPEKSKSGKYIFINSYSTLSREVQFLDSDKPNGNFRIFQPRERTHEYFVYHHKDKFFIVTNDKAKNFRLMETPANRTRKQNWKEVIPHRNDTLLEDIDIFGNFIVVSERKNGLVQLKIIDLLNKNEHYLEFGEQAYYAYSTDNYEMGTNILRYQYTSLTTPNTTFDYNMTTKEKTLLKQVEVLGGFNKDNYQTERLYATAGDGTKIPISLVYQKGLKKDGNNPLLLYAYGSYGYSTEARFRSYVLSLIDRGFVYAIAHIRGGQEMGRHWYEDGKLLKKKNTFTDYNDCAEFLISEKFTNSGKLFAQGGSAGGLLMGAIVNMRPDLYKGVFAEVPFVDVITTMLDETIPLTTGEFDEWGNPKDKTYYDYILTYSPIDNVEAKEYPAIFVTAAYQDSQVQYWEPAKWVAKLRDKKTDTNPLFLFTQMKAGHGGKSGRFEQYKEVALEYAFMLDLIGINK